MEEETKQEQEEVIEEVEAEVVKEEIQKGKILIFSSHQMSYVEEFCDSIAIIHEGKVVLTGDLKEIKRSYPRNKLKIYSSNEEKILEDYQPNVVKQGDFLLLTLKSPEEKTSVMENLVKNYDIDEIKVYEPSLNDIFVEYTA